MRESTRDPFRVADPKVRSRSPGKVVPGRLPWSNCRPRQTSAAGLAVSTHELELDLVLFCDGAHTHFEKQGVSQALPDEVAPSPRGKDRLCPPPPHGRPGQAEVQLAEVPPRCAVHQPVCTTRASFARGRDHLTARIACSRFCARRFRAPPPELGRTLYIISQTRQCSSVLERGA